MDAAMAEVPANAQRVLVTGANGFVGQALCAHLAARGLRVRAAVRAGTKAPMQAAEASVVGALGSQTDWSHAMRGVSVVVHLAAKAHVLDLPEDDGEYHRINAEATRRLAEDAARAGVRRVVFLSSIKVYGEARDRPFTANEIPEPVDVYGRSKRAGEELLQSVSTSTGLEAVIVRPPLVYGPRVRANFLRLMQWVDREIPLPLGLVRNARSLVSLRNLCDFLARSLDHPNATRQPLLVSDGHDLSTPELIRRLAHAMDRRARLLPIPAFMLQVAGTLLGRGADVSRLCGSLTLDIRSTCELMGWTPPQTVDAGLREAVAWYIPPGTIQPSGGRADV
jgi:nucleoside-diphosphate-sugar epimerase